MLNKGNIPWAQSDMVGSDLLIGASAEVLYASGALAVSWVWQSAYLMKLSVN